MFKEVFISAMKSFSIRIDSELLDKVHYVANYEDRSANAQIVSTIRQMIQDFEKEHGPITFQRKPEQK